MADVRIVLDLGKLPAVMNAADDLARHPNKFGFLRRAAGLLAASWWGETFRKQGARRGHPRWKALNPAYAARKAALGQSPDILHATGHLMGSARVLSSTQDEVVFGTRVPYAVHHQDPAVPGRPPKREIVFVTDRDLDEFGAFVQRLTQEHFDGIL